LGLALAADVDEELGKKDELRVMTGDGFREKLEWCAKSVAG